MNISVFDQYTKNEIKWYPSLFYFISTNGGKSISGRYSCKEGAVRDFSNLGLHFFRYTQNLDSLISAIHNIEDSLEIPNSEFVPIEGKHDLKVIQIKNSFWFSRKIYFDLFCCIWKTLRDKKAIILDAIETYSDLPNSTYCKHPQIRWAIENVHDLPEELNLKTIEDDQRFLFNYSVNGMISALRKVAKSNDKLAKTLKVVTLETEKKDLLKKLEANEKKLIELTR